MPGRVLASCALSLGILPLAACQSAAPGLTEADRTAIQQSHDAFAKGVNAKDFATPASSGRGWSRRRRVRARQLLDDPFAAGRRSHSRSRQVGGSVAQAG